MEIPASYDWVVLDKAFTEFHQSEGYGTLVALNTALSSNVDRLEFRFNGATDVTQTAYFNIAQVGWAGQCSVN